MPQAAVTTKTLLTRSQRRTILRYMLRDEGSSVWSNAVLNSCLNEALTFVQSRYAWLRSTVLASGYKTYDLPADFVALREVVLIPTPDAEGADFDPAPYQRVLAGYQVSTSGGQRSYASTSSTSTHLLSLETAVPEGYSLMVWYEAARQPWGDIQVVDTGVDSAADQDLRPGELVDGEAELLFYAVARCAAYRYALGYIKSDGAAEWAAQYEYAKRERDELLGQAARSVSLRFTSGLFG